MKKISLALILFLFIWTTFAYDCKQEIQAWVDAKNTEQSIVHYESCLSKNPSASAKWVSETSLIHLYSTAIDNFIDLKNYNKAITYAEKLVAISWLDRNNAFGLFLMYIEVNDLQNAKKYYEEAKKLAFSKEEVDKTIQLWTLLDSIEQLNEWVGRNDILAYKQYYLTVNNIFAAQQKITNPKQVVVAVLDDGININHPDITNNIWVNTKEISRNGVDNDNNGYIDDYNGFNFIYNSNNIAPLWSHGTMVAGIIGASMNNQIWIAGIAKNVKIMSVGVCSESWCPREAIVKWIKYAIDNGADIINLSLWDNQFSFSTEYNEVLQEAFDKNIIVVVAAGNGDVLSNNQAWVNTSINKLSPLCNYGNSYKNIIGVGALTKQWYRADRSNYGNCVDFFVPWEEIESTSIWEILYTSANGTSFSAPIVAGIIALWFNKYGKMHRNAVYDALSESFVKNSVWNDTIDAAKYLDALWNKVNDPKYNIYQAANTDKQTELNQAINWLYENELTIFNTQETFMADKFITREQASKFFDVFNRKTKNTYIAIDAKACNFSDITNADKTLVYHIWQACQYGIILWSKWKFNPFGNLTKAQAITILVRIIDWWLKDETGGVWYQKYYEYAQNTWLLNNMWYSLSTLDKENITRWDMAILIYRVSKF